jgi:hypothetical protein
MTISARISALSACLALTLVACDEKDSAPDKAGDSSINTPDGEEESAEHGEEESAEQGEEESAEQGEEESAEQGEQPGEQPGEEPYDPHMEDWPAPAVPCPDIEPQRECVTADGAEGYETCVMNRGEPHWTECTTEWLCAPGDSYDQGCIGSYCAWDGEKLFDFGWQTDPMCETPLVLQFDAAPLTFTASPAGTGFDFRGESAASTCHTDWPSAPWLALDRDRDGAIDSGRELFGSGTRLAAGGRAAHGFEALAELDSDGDGSITPTDAMFSSLVLWTDHDADRVGTLPELRPVSDAGLVAIHLAYTRQSTCDARGNCGGERASFEFRAADGAITTGEIVDVYLACQ